MAPPPEYDKEPKAPDKSVTNISSDDSKVLYNHVKEQQNNSDHKSSNPAANADVENNKHVGALDDGQLRALLDEAIAYKRPKDREGKSSLFKELLEEVEQDEQACEAAARVVTGTRGCARRSGHGRRALPHSNSLQDLMAAALAAEPPRQRAQAHPPPASVSARAHHGGSLPSGVDTSSMLSEEPTRGGYLATVRCVNPPPLAERRVSASDTNAPIDHEHTRRGKQSFPLTYTARATLEIGGSSVSSGRAVTTTTPSNQVAPDVHRRPTAGPPERLYAPRLYRPSARPTNDAPHPHTNACGNQRESAMSDEPVERNNAHRARTPRTDDLMWTKSVESWYEGLNNYFISSEPAPDRIAPASHHLRPLKKNFHHFVANERFVSELHAPNCNLHTHFRPRSNSIYTPKEKDDLKVTSTDNALIRDSLSNAKHKDMRKSALVAPTVSPIHAKNIRSATIGNIEDEVLSQRRTTDNEPNTSSVTGSDDKRQSHLNKDQKLSNVSCHNGNNIEDNKKSDKDSGKLAVHEESEIPLKPLEANDVSVYQMIDIPKSHVPNTESESEIEMVNLLPNRSQHTNSFSKFVDEQQKLFEMLETENNTKTGSHTSRIKENEEHASKRTDIPTQIDEVLDDTEKANNNEDKTDSNVRAVAKGNSVEEQFNKYAILTLTKHPSSTNSPNERQSDNFEKDSKSVTKDDPKNLSKSKRSAITVLLLENLFQRADKLRPMRDNEIDSAIPFSCITTPEVVSSCSTTTSTGQCAVAVDPKPLQLGSGYRAVSCLTGEAPPRRAAPAPAASPAAPPPPPASPHHQQPRSVISSSFNGLPLTRSGYGATGTTPAVGAAAATATAATEECKKSLDENGNSVQGFSSPLSGSSHNKKPRRKKSSKNETVIKSQEIDGYQGNKDLNEVLRFIESNAEGGRGAKVGRAKHKEDADEKAAKKRSTERRKDKENKVKRATSMEELSRTKLEDLTDKPAPRAEPAKPPKPERRSWGEDRDPFYLRDAEAPPEPSELTDFQTVTKKRKPRRRTDDPEPPRRSRPPAPPSDRSNDSNDDMDSVHSLHSLPADAAQRAAPPPPAHASYADIARTRHNIPDLIESCNFYAEGESAERGGEQRQRQEVPADAPAPVQGDADYPALVEARAANRRRDKGAARHERARKERGEAARPADCPAPDVVADRRPAVILLDCASRPRDMDGVTFGFDINEQLVGGTRRPRCDLVRDALEGAGAVAVAVAGAALRYLPPPHHHRHDARHLHQIVDYVGNAWEDVVRCGGGKVRYFSE